MRSHSKFERAATQSDLRAECFATLLTKAFSRGIFLLFLHKWQSTYTQGDSIALGHAAMLWKLPAKSWSFNQSMAFTHKPAVMLWWRYHTDALPLTLPLCLSPSSVLPNPAPASFSLFLYPSMYPSTVYSLKRKLASQGLETAVKFYKSENGTRNLVICLWK